MEMDQEPVVGQWYRDIEQRLFEVVALDHEFIEIQYFDGDVDELDADTWQQMSIFAVAEPGDGTGPFDESDDDEFSFSQNDYRTASW